MKPIPIAMYLNRFGKAQATEPSARPRESVLLKPRVVPTRQDIDARIAEAFEQGRRQGVEAARAESAEASARGEEERLQLALSEQDAFRANEYAELADQIAAGLAEIEQRIAAGVARILQNYVTQEQSMRVAQALSDNLARMLSGDTAPILKIKGPEHLLAVLRERLASFPITIECGVVPGIDVTVEAQDTVIASQLKPWIDHIEFDRQMSGPMDEKQPEIVIIKRMRSHEEEHHGGAWKIAFADFMTAMMAFFLVLWIINATDKNTKSIIAHYFNAVKLEDPSRAKKGIREDAVNPTDANSTDDDTNGVAGAAPNARQIEQQPADKAADSKIADKQAKPAADEGAAGPGSAAMPKPTLSESALFTDPYASLDKIAGPVASSAQAQTAAAQEAPANSAADLDLFRDPFKPTATGGTRDFVSDDKTEPPTSVHASVPAAKNEALNSPHPRPADKAPPPAANDQSKSPPRAAPPSTAASLAVPPASSTAVSPSHAGASIPQTNAVAQLSKDIADEISGVTGSQAGPGIEVKATEDGVLISLTDRLNFSMFAIGSAEPQPDMVRIMTKIAQTLKSQPGMIILRGFTDGRPYKSATYDNWRLSSARAQMAYYMLVRGGLAETRFRRVEGYADRELKNPGDPNAAENRRIEILLSGKKP